MTSQTRSITPLLVLILAIAAGTSNLGAQVVTFLNGYSGTASVVNSSTELAYAADVSNSDLLNGKIPAITGWNLNNEAHANELTDGAHGLTFQGASSPDSVHGAWTTVSATAIYTLGLGANNLGYDISSIQSIASWNGASFGDQAWTLAVRLVGSANYVNVATINYQIFGASNPGATKVTLSNLNITGIHYLKVTANQVNDGANAGAFVWRELDAIGTPTSAAGDITPPTLNTLTSVTPTDEAMNVPVSSNLTATFSEPITLTGAGSITLRNQSGGADIPVPLPGDVSIAGAVLTINPTSNLVNGQQYAVEISSNAIKDLATAPNAYAGLLATATSNWTFTTMPVDFTHPSLVSFNPADDAGTVPPIANLVATFSENISLGTGTITIKDLETATQTVITLPDARVSVSGTVLTINPSTNLSAATDYAVRIASGAITDIAGNPFAGISDDDTWNFTTTTSPLRIMCLGDSITAGYTDNPSWANHPFMFGYRSGLYSCLTNAGYNFQFVGASTEPWSATQNGDPTYGGTYKPALDLRDFGQDGHRGYGGAAIWSNVNAWIAADAPDVILLMIGINGIGSGSPAALNNLVNSIVTTAPGVRLVIAQITPRVSFNQALYDYNLYIRNTLVPNYAGNGHKVTTVDLYSLFLTDPNNYSSAIKPGVLANNINHPNNPQYDLMAQEWFEGIEALRIGPNTFSKWITDPAFGIAPGQQGLDQDPDGDGIENGGENFFGTDPGEFNPGLVAGVKSGNIFTFTHPQNPSPAIDLSAAYHWTKNPASFHAGGATDGLTTVTFAAEANTPSSGTTRVTATVTGTSPDRLFIKVGVSSH